MYRRDLVRRMFVPALIIIIGVVIAWWSAERRKAEIEQARQYVQTLCIDLIKARRSANRDAAIDSMRDEFGRPFANDLTREKLIGRLVERNASAENLRVRIRPGDLPGPLGDGNATHHAAVLIDDAPVIVLRLQYSDKPGGTRRILGYKLPEKAM